MIFLAMNKNNWRKKDIDTKARQRKCIHPIDANKRVCRQQEKSSYFPIVLKLPAIVYTFFKRSSSNDANVRAFWSADTKVIDHQTYSDKIPQKNTRGPTIFRRLYLNKLHAVLHAIVTIRNIVTSILLNCKFLCYVLARECVLSNYIHGLNGLNH